MYLYPHFQTSLIKMCMYKKVLQHQSLMHIHVLLSLVFKTKQELKLLSEK